MENQQISTSVSKIIPPAEYDQIMAMSKLVFSSGLAPKKFENSAAVAVAGFYGRELGLSLMRSVREIHVIEGMPTMSANLMLTKIREHGFEFKIVKETDEECVVAARRTKDAEWDQVGFTIAEAKKAGFVKERSNWEKSPKDMLFARAVSRLFRRYFSDISAGISYTPEEIIAEVKNADEEKYTPKTEAEGGVARDKNQIEEAQIVTDEIDEDAILELAGTFVKCETLEAIEKAYDAFRVANDKKPSTLIEAFGTYNNAVKNFKVKSGETILELKGE